MTKQQNNKRAMLESVVSLIETNATRTSSIPELAASASRLKDVVVSMHDKTAEVQQASAGKAAAKSEMKDNLRFVLFAVTAGLYAYAVKKRDPELQTKARIRFSEIQKMREADLAVMGEVILRLAKEAGAGIEPHGIQPGVVSELESTLAAFKAMLGEVKSGIAARVAGRRTLEELYAEADGILADELDRYFEVLEGSDSELANAYFTARVIGKPGYRHQPQQPANVISQPTQAKAA